MRFATLFLVLILAACDEGPLEPELAEAAGYEFSMTVERTSNLGPFLAHHEVGATLEPKDFHWPTTFDGHIGRWEPDSSPAHSAGISLGFNNVAPGSGRLVVEYSVEWVNGETAKPFTFSPVVGFTIERYYGKEGVEKMVVPFTRRQVGRSRYRVEVPIPADPAEYYNISLVPGVTFQCNAEGIKSSLLRDVTYSGAGFLSNKLEGSLLFTGACQRPLPRYSATS